MGYTLASDLCVVCVSVGSIHDEADSGQVQDDTPQVDGGCGGIALPGAHHNDAHLVVALTQ